MSKRNETLERMSEVQRSDELMNNPVGNMNYAFNRAGNGNLVDLVGSLDWKSTGILFIVIIIGLAATTFYLY